MRNIIPHSCLRPGCARVVLPALSAAVLALGAARTSAAPKMTEHVLFAFDRDSIPFVQGLKLDLAGFEVAARKQGNVVLRPGPPGSPDAFGLHYYGSVAHVGGEYWMWYEGIPYPEGWVAGIPSAKPGESLICLAKSQDGIHWDKPGLGLVDYNGRTDNNLVSLDGHAFHIDDPCMVLYEPDEPNPARRFKMVFNVQRYHMRLAVAFSPDGIHWTEGPDNPRGPWIEPSGLMKWKGAYYVDGQSLGHWAAGGPYERMLETLVSYDFVHWSQISALGFRRDARLPRPVDITGSTDGEQVHLGASLWNRGNVIVGFYGMWHGSPTNDRRLVSIDIGLVVSHDGLHYWEPIPDFRIVPAREVTYHLPDFRAPAIAQGQGFANIGDQTLFWYGAWADPQDGIRVASWERDRLGYLHMWLGGPAGCAISAPIHTHGVPVAVYANVTGLGPNSVLKVSVLDEQMRVIPGFETSACTGPTRSGLRELATWGGRTSVTSRRPIRIRVDFAGLRPEDIRLYALYVAPVPKP